MFPLCSHLVPNLSPQLLIAPSAFQISVFSLFSLFVPTFPRFPGNSAGSELRCNNTTRSGIRAQKSRPGGRLVWFGWRWRAVAGPSRCVPAVAAHCPGAGCPGSWPRLAAWCGAAPQIRCGCRRGRSGLLRCGPAGPGWRPGQSPGARPGWCRPWPESRGL